MNPKSPLFLVQTDDTLVSISPAAPDNEKVLQDLIASHPQLIDEGGEPLLLIRQELGIPGAADGPERWSIDHLFVSTNAVPVLVEVKRAVDTRLRREVVGQMLDYAANGVAYWPKGLLQARFEASCQGMDPAEVLAKFLGGEERDVGGFWARVEDNLRTGRIKMLFVADEIPSELARIVEFLNDQMVADVRAVELNYFQGPDGARILAPRIIGETERSKVSKGSAKLPPLTVDEWLAKHIEPRGAKTLNGAKALLKFMSGAVGSPAVASTQGSIYSCISQPNGKNSYPFFLSKAGGCQIGFGWLGGSPALAPEVVRKSFYDRFAGAVGPLSSSNFMTGFPSFPLASLDDPARLRAFIDVAQDFVDQCKIT